MWGPYAIDFSALPSSWKIVLCPETNWHYFRNTSTGKCQWHPPGVEMPSAKELSDFLQANEEDPDSLRGGYFPEPPPEPAHVSSLRRSFSRIEETGVDSPCHFCKQPTSLVVGGSSGLTLPVHKDCLLWHRDVEVKNEEGTVVSGVESAANWSSHKMCHACKEPGASITCGIPGCALSFHAPCARKNRLVIGLDGSVHRPQQLWCREHEELARQNAGWRLREDGPPVSCSSSDGSDLKRSPEHSKSSGRQHRRIRGQKKGL